MVQTLRFLFSGAGDGFRNMAIDEALLEECKSGRVPGALRVYQWDPPAISLGYSQSIDLVDLERCRASGVDVVRRITGGGAVLHWEEITYCFVVIRALLGDSPWPRQFARLTATAVGRALSALGVVALVSSGRGNPRGRGEKSPLCFTSEMENEVDVEGRKLAGCAHKFTGEAYFSHGSIMTGSAHARIVELLTSRAATADSLALKERSVSLSELLKSVPSLERAGRALRDAFETSFDLSFADERLSDAEERLIIERTLEKRRTGGRRKKAVT